MSEWKERKLGDVAEIQTGPFGSQLHQRDYKVVGTPIITVEHLGENRVLHQNLPLVGDTDKERLKRYIIYDGDIVFSRVGSVDRRAYVSKRENGWMFSGRLLRVRPDRKLVSPKYLSYYFGQEDFKEHIRRIAVGATMPSINTSILSGVDILLPPLPEQRAIASVLSSLDDKIDLLHRQNKTLEAMAETLFRQWFVEEADEGWGEGKIPDEFDFTMGLSPPGESYNEEGIGIPMYQGNADFKFRFPKRRVFTTEPKRFAEQFDTLISVRAPVGAQNMADERCCIGRGVAAFRYKRNNGYYTYTYFKMKSLMKEIEQFNHTGTVFGSINKANFEDLAIVIPSIELVGAFQKDIKPIDDKVIANCIQIRTLEKLRDTLLPKLMSGEVRGQL
jgi:type I restriction enzyme S subunit